MVINEKTYGLTFDQPRIMGIVNVTPDSFSDGGKFLLTNAAIKHATKFVQEGADIIDIGGESSRPGSEPVSIDLEIKRVLPVIKELRKESNVLISIDTTKAEVAKQALDAGANWVNDISGMRFDPEMATVVKTWDCPAVIMHMQGVPKSMQNEPKYENVLREIMDFFSERIKFLNDFGIKKIIVDPGIGFGKRLEDNLILLARIEEFRKFNLPVLVGTSRKSFIGMLTGREVSQRLAGSLATVVWSAIKGVDIFRVHDVAETKDSIEIVKRLLNCGK